MDEKKFGKNMSSGAEKVENINDNIPANDLAALAAWGNIGAGAGLGNTEGVFGGAQNGLMPGVIVGAVSEPVEGMGNGAETPEQERKAAERRVAQARARLAEKKRRAEERSKKKEKDGSQNSGFGSGMQTNANGGGSQGKQQNGGGKKRGDGLGGWIAAVVSLGAVSLALTAVVTVGAIRMDKQMNATASSYRATMYEFMHVIEEADDDLAALRIAQSPTLQADLLTGILVQTRIAETDLEKLPLDTQSSEKTMRFFNGISRYCEFSLERLARGETLTERDFDLIEDLYEVLHETREMMDDLAAKMEDDDMMMWMKGKENRIEKTLQAVENATDKHSFMRKKPPHSHEEKDQTEMPKPIPSGGKMQDRAGIPSQKAEEICKRYFADYGVKNTVYAGETLGKGLKAYNFQMETESGVGMFAQLSQEDGSLIYFDYYAECSSHVYDVETAKNTAMEFLAGLGYEDLIPVNVREGGTNADFTFIYYADGCAYYPDEITVKVCESRGIVSGFDASKYLKNHRGRCALNTKITMQQARDGLSDRLTVESARTVLFEHKGREWTAYEFFCAFDGELYFIYVDAMNGQELYIVNSKQM